MLSFHINIISNIMGKNISLSLYQHVFRIKVNIPRQNLKYFALAYHFFINKKVHDHATHITSVKPISQKWVEKSHHSCYYTWKERRYNNIRKCNFSSNKILANCNNTHYVNQQLNNADRIKKGYIVNHGLSNFEK